jgi:hypothetical protein
MQRPGGGPGVRTPAAQGGHRPRHRNFDAAPICRRHAPAGAHHRPNRAARPNAIGGGRCRKGRMSCVGPGTDGPTAPRPPRGTRSAGAAPAQPSPEPPRPTPTPGAARQTVHAPLAGRPRSGRPPAGTTAWAGVAERGAGRAAWWSARRCCGRRLRHPPADATTHAATGTAPPNGRAAWQGVPE